MTPAQQQQFRALIGNHVDWMFRAFGPPVLQVLLEFSLEACATMRNTAGGDLPPDMRRLRDAGDSAFKAYRTAMGAGIVLADATTKVAKS